MISTKTKTSHLFRKGKRLDKYRIERLISNSHFAAVYQAYDTIEGIKVALKLPHAALMDDQFFEDFRREARLAARLDHPNILSLKNAGHLEDHFVIVFPLGERTLADRLKRRMSLRAALDFSEQALEALNHAHAHRIIHCDIKPENFILFSGDLLRLTDFGISRIALRTVEGSGSGTIGYVAPEQAMGRPSFKSDIFSMGLLMYRMLSGELPKWPFDWPPPAYAKVRRRVHPELIKLILRAIEIKPSKRFRDAEQMLSAFIKIKTRALAFSPASRRTRKKNRTSRDWKEIQKKQFQREYGKELETRYACSRCGGPVSEAMLHCPWCSVSRKVFRDETMFPAQCPRCGRGLKKDWKYCPWCYGPGFGEVEQRVFSDRRYLAKCDHGGCTRKSLMSFMRYCPWCRRKVRRPWRIPGSTHKCPSCHWGVLPGFWKTCPWCGKPLAKS
ncbi:MAG: protein kinase [Planctomycetes bacterium]|nr:protein kinase [Planctomycetota bacterium]